jgi:hypothetical protein
MARTDFPFIVDSAYITPIIIRQDKFDEGKKTFKGARRNKRENKRGEKRRKESGRNHYGREV